MSFHPSDLSLKIKAKPLTPFGNSHYPPLFTKFTNGFNYRTAFSPTIQKSFTAFNSFNNISTMNNQNSYNTLNRMSSIHSMTNITSPPIPHALNVYNQSYQKAEKIVSQEVAQIGVKKEQESSEKEIMKKLNSTDQSSRDKYLNINTDKINMNINMNVSNNIYQYVMSDPLMDRKIQEEKVKKKFTCNCKKSECLKLYCDCFANGEKCIGCNCRNCSNQIGNEQIIENAYKDVTDKNPIAMKLNLQKQLKINGCNCSKSNCLKKYCECYKAGLLCSESCRCTKCNNMDKEKKSESGSEIKNKIKNNIYEGFTFEKISVFINKGVISIERYEYLKSLNLKEGAKNNVIFKMVDDEDFIEIPKKMLNLEEEEDEDKEKGDMKDKIKNENKNVNNKENINENSIIRGNIIELMPTEVKNIKENEKEDEMNKGIEITKGCIIGNLLGKKIIRPISIITNEEAKE